MPTIRSTSSAEKPGRSGWRWRRQNRRSDSRSQSPRPPPDRPAPALEEADAAVVQGGVFAVLGNADEVGLRLGGIAGVVIVRRGGLFLLAAGGEGQGQRQQAAVRENTFS